MLITASKYTSSGRCLHTHQAVTARALGAPSNAGLRRMQQTRGYRFFFPSNFFDDDCSRDVRRRHRKLKHAYSEQLNRRMSWDNHPFAEDPRHALKRMMKSYWHDARPGNRFGGDRFCDDAEPIKSNAVHGENVRPVQNAEDVKGGATDDLLFVLGTSERNNCSSGRGRKHRSALEEKSHGLRVEHDDFFIDPITNRKVSKLAPRSNTEDGVDIPVTTFRTYRSQCGQRDDAPGQIDKNLQGHLQNEDSVDQSSRADPGSYKYSQDLRKLKPQKDRNALYGASFDDLLSYKPFQDSEFDQNLMTSAEKLTTDNLENKIDHSHVIDETHSKFDDLKPPFGDAVADEYRPLVADELAKRVQDSNAYVLEPTIYEADMAKDIEPVLDPPAEHDSAGQEGQPWGFNEELVTPEALRQFRSSVKRVKPGDFPEWTCESLRARYREAQWELYRTGKYSHPDGPSTRHLDEQCSPGDQSSSVEQHSAEEQHSPEEQQSPQGQRVPEELNSTEDVSKYGPYYYNEPDGKPLSSEEEPNQDSRNLRRYDSPCRFDEPGGELPLTKEDSLPEETSLPEELSFPEEDPNKEGRLGEAEDYHNRYLEEGRGNAEDYHNHYLKEGLGEAEDYHNPYLEMGRDDKTNAPEDEADHTQGQSDSQDAHEPISLNRDGMSHLLQGQEDSQQFQCHEVEERSVSEIDAAREELGAQVQDDISSNRAPAGDDGFISGREGLQKLNSVYRGQGRYPGKIGSAPREEPDNHPVSSTQLLESLNSWKEGLKKISTVNQGHGTQLTHWDNLESSAKVHEQLSDAYDEEATLAVKSAKAKSQQGDVSGHKLTGNYVRDFPEEFEKNWTQTLSSVPTEAETSYKTDAVFGSESMDGGLEGAFGRPSPSIIQPALDRHNSDEAGVEKDDLYSTQPQYMETSYYEDCGKATQPLLFKQYGTSDGAAGDMSTFAEENATTASKSSAGAVDEPDPTFRETSSAATNEPVLYKILAYDPTTQQINVAQTSSMVPDFASPLSPADVLLRLSHPAKFFPHFASLEAEGFEIASGSADVLVFRKARPSKPALVEDTATKAAVASCTPQSTEPPINPIDMTGRVVASPASANFASPTGYVKYDNLPETEASNLPPPPPPRVAYNINLRREEPVYSGPKYKSPGEQKQKPGLGQRLLVGGVWLAGLSYGLGVVSEYFTTGGLDGLGPSGL